MAGPPETLGFSQLPTELLEYILLDLDLRDLKSLRAAGVRCDPLILSRLFRRVCLSMLHKDRSAFLSIASSLHLARRVHILEWVVFPDTTKTLNQWLDWTFGKATQLAREQGMREIVDACWLPIAKEKEIRMQAWDAFCPMLDTALLTMSQLNMFQLRDAQQCNPANRLGSFAGCRPADRTLVPISRADPEYETIKIPRNFFGRAMQRRNCHRGICFACSTAGSTAAYTYTCFYDTVGCLLSQNLTYLEVFLDDVNDKYMDIVASQLLSVRALEQLVLSSKFEKLPDEPTWRVRYGRIGTSILEAIARNGGSWHKLEHLSLAMMGMSVASLKAFFALHTATLSRVDLKHCGLTLSHLQALETLPLEQLKSFSVQTPFSSINIPWVRGLRLGAAIISASSGSLVNVGGIFDAWDWWARNYRFDKNVDCPGFDVIQIVDYGGVGTGN